MKKLAVAVVALCLFATPVLACPGHEAPATEVKTADKDKDTSKDKSTDTAKAKDADKAKAPAKDKAADTKAPAKQDPKKPDKVSSK
jgi:hypothetical protein